MKRILIWTVVISIGLVTLYLNLQNLTDSFTYKLLGLNPDSRFAGALNFFIYDSLKITILLFVISSLMGVVNSYFPVEKLRDFLVSRKLYGFQYVLASLFGAITPFCSCSSIPLFIGFVKGGIPLGVTFSFLITSPLVNEVAVAMFLGLFGLKTTLIYTISGVLLGTVGGYLLGKFNLEKLLSPWVLEIQKQGALQNSDEFCDSCNGTFSGRLPSILNESFGIVKKVILYIFIGIGIGAAMHGYVPEHFFSEWLSSDKWYTVPLAVISAVPLYANAAGIVPVVQVLVAKGVPLGTAIAFMMGVVGLSLPEATLLKKVMTWKLIGIFFCTITLFIILLGYLFNIIL